MICGSAAGELLPPYIVYKAQNTYEQWCIDGPQGAVYTSTVSGWFDGWVFTDWFKNCFLKHVRRNSDKKMLVGDNLRSHISLEVIDLCRKNDIQFVCLPPNSTHLTQPLDVGYFGPLKASWKKQLIKYSKEDLNANLLCKKVFPRMLKELLDSVIPAELLPPAFERCGLYPIQRKKVTERLPSKDKAKTIARHLDKALLDRLEERRFPVSKKKGRGKKIPAGKSYTDMDTEEEEEEESEVSGDDESMGPPSEDEDEVALEQTEEVDSDLESLPELQATNYKTGQFVVAVYEEEWFLAEVALEQEDVAKGYTRLKYMAIKGVNSFCWGLRPDIHVACNEDILLPVIPEPINNRGHLGLTKKDHTKVLSLMVEFYLFPLAFFEKFILIFN